MKDDLPRRPREWDVLGLGAVAVDDLLYVDQYPLLEEKERVHERRREGGGLAGTALVAASRLGASAAYCGVLGDDELSRFTLAELRHERVDCSPTSFNSEARPHHSTIIVIRSTGHRTIFSCNEGVREPDSELITAALINRCRVLFVDHTVVSSACKAALLAKQHAIPVVADIERSTIDGLSELMPLIDHLIVGVRTGQQLTDQALPIDIVRSLQDSRACTVVTDGANGCWYQKQNSEPCHMPAFEVEVVDTTGCGDVFHGAYAASIAFGEPPEAAVSLGSAAAALKATQQGGRRGIPTRATLDAFIASMR